MKLASKQCPNNHGAMKRCHIKITKDRVQSWHAIPWQFCPECRVMLPDWISEHSMFWQGFESPKQHPVNGLSS